MLSNRLPSTLALGEFAQSMRGGSESSVTLTVDPAISGKPICLFGANFMGKARLIRNAASLYGLRLTTSDDHSFVFRLPRRGTIENPQDVPGELANLIPPSLLRSLSSEPAFLAKKASSRAEEPLTPTEMRIAVARANHNQAYMGSGTVTAASYYFPAVKRLRTLAEPAVPGKGSPPVRVKDLGPEPERLIALMTLAGQGLMQLSVLRDYTPPSCFFDVDDMVVQISGGSRQIGNSPSKSVSTQFGYRDENGKFEREFGMRTTTLDGR